MKFFNFASSLTEIVFGQANIPNNRYPNLTTLLISRGFFLLVIDLYPLILRGDSFGEFKHFARETLRLRNGENRAQANETEYRN